MGYVLQLATHLEALAFYKVQPRPSGISLDFQDLPSDVRRHRHCYR